MTPRFPPADTLDLPALTTLWNRAYEGYLVPLHFTPEMLSRHVDRAQVDLGRSRVLTLDAEHAGVSLVGLDGDAAYLAGFGISPGHRRGGWGHRLLGEQLVALHDAGLRTVQLEVIESNPARQLYAQAGFVQTRRLQVLNGRFDAVPVPTAAATGLHAPTPGELRSLHDRLNTAPPTWRRQWARVSPLLDQPNVVTLALADNAYALVSAGPEALGLLDAAARDVQSALALLTQLEAHYPGRSWRLVDEPEGTPIGRAATQAGLKPQLWQVEMRAPLPVPVAHDR